MKLKIMENIQKGKLTLLAGKVTRCREGSGSSEGKVVNVTLEGIVWNGDLGKEETKAIDVAFWNADDGSKHLADRIKKAKVGVGSFITALVIMKDDGKNATGINFKYSGLWTFPEKEGQKEVNILVGTVASLTEDNDGRFVRISMPVSKNSEETEWHNVTFWNNDKQALGDRAKICLKPRSDGRKVKAVVVCGENRPYNDSPSYSGFRFEIIPE